MQTSTIVVSIIFVFTFMPLVLAEVARNKSVPSVEDFFLCSRGMSAFLSFFTIYSTWYSAFAVIGSSAYFYFKGPIYMTAFAWNVLFGLLFYFLGRRLWFYGRRSAYITPSDFFRDIYQSKFLTVLVTIIILCFTIPYLQIQFAGGAYLIDIASSGRIPWKVAGLIFYIIMIVYLWAGGLRAVAIIDVFFGILVFMTLIGTGILLASKTGSMGHIFSVIMDDNIENVTLSGQSEKGGISLWLAMFLITPLGAFMSPSLWIRNFAVKDEKTFSLMPFLISIAAVGYIGCLIAGNAGRILHPDFSDANTLMPYLISQYGSQILIALLFCGLAASALSTANSQIHALSAIYTIDIHKRYINKGASGNRLLFVGKCAVLGFSAIAYIFTVSSSGGMINTGLLALSGTVQLLVPVMGALFWKKSNAKGASAGILGGVILLMILYLGFRLEACYCGVIGLAVNSLIFIFVCCCTKQDPVTRSKIVDYRRQFAERDSQ